MQNGCIQSTLNNLSRDELNDNTCYSPCLLQQSLILDLKNNLKLLIPFIEYLNALTDSASRRHVEIKGRFM